MFGVDVLSRRNFCGLGAGALLALPTLSYAAPQSKPSPRLLGLARAALEHHQLTERDTIGVIDFAAASREPRFHLVDMANGRTSALLVAHGRGSDPDHSGWVQRLSNLPGSYASSAGAYLTSDLYTGKHGRSRRLKGLDAENSNVESRAIVIHAASYVGADIARAYGKLGRSEGCLAVAEPDLDFVLAKLGPSRLIYVDRLPTAVR